MCRIRTFLGTTGLTLKKKYNKVNQPLPNSVFGSFFVQKFSTLGTGPVKTGSYYMR